MPHNSFIAIIVGKGENMKKYPFYEDTVFHWSPFLREKVKEGISIDGVLTGNSLSS